MWTSEYGDSCAVTPAWTSEHGHSCVGTPAWTSEYGHSCVGTPTWTSVCGYSCEGTPVWGLLRGRRCVGTPVRVLLRGRPCAGTPAWTSVYGYSCVGTPVWTSVCGHSCVDTHVWTLLRGQTRGYTFQCGHVRRGLGGHDGLVWSTSLLRCGCISRCPVARSSYLSGLPCVGATGPLCVSSLARDVFSDVFTVPRTPRHSADVLTRLTSYTGANTLRHFCDLK